MLLILPACISPRNDQLAGDAGTDGPALPDPADGPSAERPDAAGADGPGARADRSGSPDADSIPTVWLRAMTPASAVSGATRAVAVSGDQIYATGWFQDRVDFGGMVATAAPGS